MFVEKPLTPGMGTVRKGVAGVGINDADYVTGYVGENGTTITCPFYSTWAGMLERVYSKKFHKRSPTYSGCTVEESWKTFSNFRKWMQSQDWKDKALDKDLLVQGNKHYGPDTCVFVDRQVNALTVLRGNARGSLPLGVTKSKNNGYTYYLAKCSFYGKQKTLGNFKTIEEAENCYRQAKRKYIEEIANKQKDPRVRKALLNFSF